MQEMERGKALADRIKPRTSALAVIDVQNDFCHGEGFFSKKNGETGHVQRMIGNLESLLEKWRQAKMPVIFVRTIHSEWTDSAAWLTRGGGMAEKAAICGPDSWGAEFFEVQPESRDCVVTKHRYSAFVGTDLDLILRSRGLETILFAGVATNVCVESTLRDAFNRNYHVVLVEDCCAAFSAEEHAAAVSNVRRYFGTVTDSKVLEKILPEAP